MEITAAVGAAVGAGAGFAAGFGAGVTVPPLLEPPFAGPLAPVAPDETGTGPEEPAAPFRSSCCTNGSFERNSPNASSWPDCGEGTVSGSVMPSPPGVAAA